MVNSRAMTTDLARRAGLSTERFLQTEQEADIAEEILAKEMATLSLDQRERAILDMHGIHTLEDRKGGVPIDENDKETMDQLFRELEQELNNIPAYDREAYDLAKFLNPAYVESPKVRLMFLRSERFDVKTAARTMAYHFKVKRQLFGDTDVLAREVYQSDLGPEEMEYARCGMFQILPTTDMAGRLVEVISMDDFDTTCDPTIAMRAMWYVCMVPLREDEVQRSGVVCCFFQYKQLKLDMVQMAEYNKLEISIPQKYVANHMCFADSRIRPFVTGILMMVDKEERSRYKIHYGSPLEINYSLMTMGIPADEIPMHPDGWKTDWHCQWLEAVRLQEEKLFQQIQQQPQQQQQQQQHPQQQQQPPLIAISPPPPTASNTFISDLGVVIPRSQDVLFGKTAKALNNPGNLRAHQLVNEYFEEYEKGFKPEKTRIANQIVTKIQELGGRFLKKSKVGLGTWEVVSDVAAREKVSHWLRHMRHKTSSKTKKGDDAGGIKRASPVDVSSGSDGGTPVQENDGESNAGGIPSSNKVVRPSYSSTPGKGNS
eukprot:Nitzschia sp. Nitz4//scaffold83_size84149//45259//46973//NITZ4_005174-RA/size84149-processed-gene-0.97-mRNA-1//-1//CDS//3329558947//1669//frame0